ncbi:phage tail terminator protein [Rhizobium herbae]
MIQSIIARLQEPGTLFAIAGGAAALADVKDAPLSFPAVYVFISDERSSENQRMGRIMQRTVATIGVVIVTKNLSTINNAAAATDIEVLRKYCRRKLLGFIPADAEDPMEHVGGELQQALGGVIWFEDAYTTSYYIEEEQ